MVEAVARSPSWRRLEQLGIATFINEGEPLMTLSLGKRPGNKREVTRLATDVMAPAPLVSLS